MDEQQRRTLPIQSDPEIVSGTPVFNGTRVPVQTLFDYLEDGSSIDEFLDNFPTVSREYVMQVIEYSAARVSEEALPG